MKALVKARAEPGIWMEDVPEPAVGHNDVLIKVHRSAICGTDMHIYNWDAWAQKTVPVPMAVGHEYAGEIVEMGSEVRGFQTGDRVSGEGHITCGHCRNCRAGRRHLCRNTSGVGVNRPGAFAEYLTIPAANVFKLPAAIDDEIASILDPFGNHFGDIAPSDHGHANHERQQAVARAQGVDDDDGQRQVWEADHPAAHSPAESAHRTIAEPHGEAGERPDEHASDHDQPDQRERGQRAARGQRNQVAPAVVRAQQIEVGPVHVVVGVEDVDRAECVERWQKDGVRAVPDPEDPDGGRPHKWLQQAVGE